MTVGFFERDELVTERRGEVTVAPSEAERKEEVFFGVVGAPSLGASVAGRSATRSAGFSSTASVVAGRSLGGSAGLSSDSGGLAGSFSTF